MKSRQIIFSAQMVRALREGRKTQTRRKVKPYIAESIEWFGESPCFMYDSATDDNGVVGEPEWLVYSGDYPEEGVIPLGQCPYGQIGDELWVRETFAIDPKFGGIVYRADGEGWVAFREDGEEYDDDGVWKPKWKPSIHMPRDLSRITLTITDIRVQRLQDISEEDAWAEGCEGFDDDFTGGQSGYGEFLELWNGINGPGSWEANPFVWALSFDVRVKQ